MLWLSQLFVDARKSVDIGGICNFEICKYSGLPQEICNFDRIEDKNSKMGNRINSHETHQSKRALGLALFCHDFRANDDFA